MHLFSFQNFIQLEYFNYDAYIPVFEENLQLKHRNDSVHTRNIVLSVSSIQVNLEILRKQERLLF